MPGERTRQSQRLTSGFFVTAPKLSGTIVQYLGMFNYSERMGLLNTQGPKLADEVERRLIRAGLPDLSVLSMRAEGGYDFALRRGASLYRLAVQPVDADVLRVAALPADPMGWVTLYVAARFTSSQRDQMAQRGLSFLDATGAAHLALDGRTVLLSPATTAVTTNGRTDLGAADELAPSREPSTVAHLDAALTGLGQRVTFALLSAPELAHASQRELAHVAGVSVGTAHRVTSDLAKAGHFGKDGQLIGTATLLDEWARAWAGRPAKALAGTALYADSSDWVHHPLAVEGQRILKSGAAAATQLVPDLHATDGLVYTTTKVVDIVKQLRLSPRKTPWRVQIRPLFWGDQLPSARRGLVPATLLYADLLQDGDARLADAAKTLRASHAHLLRLDHS